MRDAFTCGPPVYGENFFGRAAFLANLRDAMLAGSESTLLIGESRIGKTSILQQLSHILPPDEGTAVFFDGWCGGCAQRLALELGRALAEAPGLGRRAARAGEKGLSPLLRLLESSHQRLTLLVDEVDGIVVDKECARFIRSAASLGHKIIIAASRIDPAQHDTSLTEPPWWNVFRIQYVGLFTQKEVNDLLLTLSERSGERFADGECAFLQDMVGGFPYFLQWLGKEVFARGYRNCTTSQRRTLFQELATDCSLVGMLGEYFGGWLDRLDDRRIALLVESASGRGIAPQHGMIQLKNRGLLVEDNGRWHPFSRLFGEFLRARPKGPLVSDNLKGMLLQGLLPALKAAAEVAAKHYL